MRVNLVAVTRSLERLDLGLEELIAYYARVSNPGNQANHETAPRLLRYLIKHSHWSPFEMVSATVEVQTSRAISAQLLRHRSFVFQEFSQRYAAATEVEDFEARTAGSGNRQGSSTDRNAEFEVRLNGFAHAAIDLYKEALAAGVAKECARMMLPMATQTRLYMSGTIRSWYHYLMVRCTPETQPEHRAVALEIKRALLPILPTVLGSEQV